MLALFMLVCKLFSYIGNGMCQNLDSCIKLNLVQVIHNIINKLITADLINKFDF